MSILFALRSVVHLLLVLSIAAWGFLAYAFPFPALLIGLGMLVAAIVVWALFLSPKPVLAVDRFGRAIVELLLIAGAVASLLTLGVFWVVPVLLGLVAAGLGFFAARSS